MICRLCKKPAQLRSSHIIPEFFYRTMYDSKHRYFTISSDAQTKDRTHQKGLRESLLCDCCEGLFAKNEKYFSELFHGGVEAEFADDGRHLLIRGIDYHKTKLMFLSVLWRMGVSSLKQFREVQLGPHEDRLRTMLLAETPGAANEYGVMGVAPYFEQQSLGHFITEPDVARIHAN